MDNSNFIIHEQARHYHWQGSGLLSIKSFFGGMAIYNIGQGAFRVDDSSYLVLNHDQDYTIEIDSAEPVQSFCMFFEEGFDTKVFYSLTQKPDKLLENPSEDYDSHLFFQRTYRHDALLSPVLMHIRKTYPIRRDEKGWLAEQFHIVMQKLLQVNNLARCEMDLLPASRSSTRKELYSRLYLAYDYILASYDQPLQLADIARIACLSPNHLLRTFKQIFGQTPYQFLTEVRLDQARQLIASTQLPITEVCLQVGFESLGSFSWLFSRRFGLSPRAFRQLNG